VAVEGGLSSHSKRMVLRMLEIDKGLLLNIRLTFYEELKETERSFRMNN
jgi:hypothetical protein